MSICHVVFVRDRELPSPAEWSEATRRAGWELSFPEPWDWATQAGMLPVVCDQVPAGFELYPDPIGDYLEENGDELSWGERWRLRRYLWAIGFETHSGADDLFAAQVAAAVLAATTEGLLLDCWSDRFVEGREAVEWARRIVNPPSPEDLARRDRTHDAVHTFLRDALADRGFHELGFVPRESPSAARWHVRAGGVFRHELVEVWVGADGADSSLCLSFFATDLALEDLRDNGLRGRVGGLHLSQLHGDGAYRSDDPPLPHVIPVDEDFASSAEGERLLAELRQADPTVFEKLRAHERERDRGS